jgi:hypothetical protein
LGLLTYIGTPDTAVSRASRWAWHRDSLRGWGLLAVRTPDSRRDFRRPQSPHRLSDWTSALPSQVSTSDRRDSRHTSGLPTPKVTKTILHAREVLECLSFDFIFVLEHSIFLRPTKFCIPLYSAAYLNPRSEKINFEAPLEFDVFFNMTN